MSSSEDDYPTLSKTFDDQLNIFSEIDNSHLPTNSEELQKKIHSSIKTLEDLTVKISYLGVFSTNESFEEISSTSLKFLMLPVLLGSLTLKRVNGEREEILRVAVIYFKDYLKRCDHYQLTSYTDADISEEENKSVDTKSKKPDLQRMNKQREEKIARYKQKKSLNEKLSELKKNIENLSHDEDIVREYFLTMIKHFIIISQEELEAIKMELEIVQGMKLMKKENVLPEEEEPPKPLKPILITKDAVQKKVFGAGYPSLPVMSVDELYEKRVKEGWYQPRNEEKNVTLANVEENKATAFEDEEEDEETKRLRERDEWRDDHKTGWGNRYNRS
ncbi:Immunoglobulin-binding protein 1 [Armadillidium nasatum]|uniref:Immunoglobulin-binding protein 1 n=1 Tax=Armadillidium nasatum TaxID=96803 RepID=A0A5N5TEW4_9CRUS|nr:Immunoglobulin-binding protein 1 [Armadillidium nasatum]